MLDRERLTDRLGSVDPDLARSVRTYVAEADFFHPLVTERLVGRGPLSIVEVGSGIGLLALLLAADGHRVTAFEPESAGYGHHQTMRGLVLSCWDGPPPSVAWHDTVFHADALDPDHRVDLALSINVLEHVPDPAGLVAEVVTALGPGAAYRVVCPNYALPYEPHFNMPTLVSKPLTARVFARRIRTAPRLDPQGLWDELSWPTQRGLAADLRARGVAARFDRRASHAYLDRVADDPTFTARKGPLLAGGVRAAGSVLHRVVDRLPVALLPIIDATAVA